MSWPGKLSPAQLSELPRSTRLPAPAFAVESGEFYQGDNLEFLRSLAATRGGEVDLIYVDPPFCAGRDFRHTSKLAAGGGFTDRWDGGLAGYLSMMQPRLYLMRELLSPCGCIYVHCDFRASAALRLLLDEIFTPQNLRGEIIWHYQSGGRSRLTWAQKHDTLLLYSRGRRWTFNADAVATRRGRQRRNHMKRDVDTDGRYFFSIRSAGKIYRYYEDEPVAPCDVWSDISHLQQKDPERTGYATQKPLALLKRVILAASNPGELVADFFAGSGTTAVAAQLLGRRWLLCDASPVAAKTAQARLANVRPVATVAE